MPALPQLTPSEKEKLKSLLEEGSTAKTKIEDLRQGLADSVDAVAKELDIKKAVINKAITAYHKGTYMDARDDFDSFEEILAICGKI